MNTQLLLSHIRSYVEFSDEDFQEYLTLLTPFTLKKNDFFYKAGEVPQYSPFILKGCTREFILTEEGEEQIILFVEEGTWAGQIGSMRSKVPTNIFLQATEDCDILGITLENLDYAMDHLPSYQRYFSKKYPMDHARLLEEALKIKTDTPENLYKWITETKPTLVQRVPQHYIANYLGIRPETMSRIRKKMSQY